MTTRRRLALATLVLFSALAVLFFTQDPIEARQRPWRGPHVTEDGWYYYHWVRSLVIDGDLDLENEYREVGNWYGFGVTRTGRRHNPFGIGPALVWTPGFVVGHVLEGLGSEPPSKPAGMSPIEQASTLFTSFLAAVGAFWLAFDLSSRLVRPKSAWLGTALAFVGGPLVWYAVWSPSMPHALEAFFGSAFLWALLPFRRRTTREALVLGVIGGGMVLIRPQLAPLLLLLLGESIVLTLRAVPGAAARATAGRGLLTLLVSVAVFSPQLWVWKLTYGGALVVPQGSEFLRFGASEWIATLFSSRNGLFTTTPLLWFVLPGFALLLGRDRATGVTALAVFAMQAWINGAAWDWWGGGAFGGRRFCATFPLWALGLALVVERLATLRRGRVAALATAGAAAAAFCALQWRMLVAHHAHAFSWEATVPFGERVRIATGHDWPGYAVTGSPFAFPANALFALRHGVPLARYDRAVGPHLLDERLPATFPLLPHEPRETVELASPTALGFLGRGFRPSRSGAELVDADGELFVPLNRPGALDLELAIDASDAVEWRFNGHPVAPEGARVPGVWRLHVNAAWVERGIHRLGVRRHSGSLTIQRMTAIEGPDWPPREAPPHSP